MHDQEMVRIISTAVRAVGKQNNIPAHVANQIRGSIIGGMRQELTERLEKQFSEEYIVVNKKEYENLKDRVHRLNEHMKSIYNPESK